MLLLFGVSSLEELSKSFKDDIRNEEVDEEGVSLFYYAISSRLFDDTKIDKIKLLEYDNNIISNTPYKELVNIHDAIGKIELENKNVLFQEDKGSYVAMMFYKILEN